MSMWGGAGRGGAGVGFKCLLYSSRLTIAFLLDSHRSFKNEPLRMIPPGSSSLPQSLVLGLACWEKMLLSATPPQKVPLSSLAGFSHSLSLSLSLQIISFQMTNSLSPPSPHQAAVIHLTRNLAVELGPRHILCNSIAPGFFPSKMASGLLEMTGGVEEMGKLNPNGRLGRPEDIAGTVVYLASRAASHVSGSCIVLDGGGLWAKGRL